MIISEKLQLNDDYTTGCLLDYNYFEKYYSMTPIDLSKHQALDFDPKAIQQINFTGNLGGAKNRVIFSVIEEAKKKHFTFFTRNRENIGILFCFNIISI